jgi:hypothetical protein
VDDVFDLGLLGLAAVRTLGTSVPEAVALAEESLAIFERMGARPLVEQVRAALALPPRDAPAPAMRTTAAGAVVEA